jgi:uncharacterized phage-associated protein
MASHIPYSPLAAANYFLQHHPPIDHMKLQKLVYCAHGWWLATDQQGSLLNERPQVWKFGPVFPSLYRALRPFGAQPISNPQSRTPFEEPDAVHVDDLLVHRLLDWIWNRYGRLSALALSDMTHKPGSAWYIVAQENNFTVPQGFEIPDRFVYSEFRSIHESERKPHERQAG